ncbi:hypothetical protein ABIC94_000913 [Variovorax paradoxus]|uniref:hypothetical protein n=1 Tax=Variovorax paradoxus TaxID=34073 RepID=UPI003390E175
MNKLLAALVAGLFAAGAFAQTPPAPAPAPAPAAPAVVHKAKQPAKHAVKKHKARHHVAKAHTAAAKKV